MFTTCKNHYTEYHCFDYSFYFLQNASAIVLLLLRVSHKSLPARCPCLSECCELYEELHYYQSRSKLKRTV